MPFPQQEIRSFTRNGIEWLLANQNGVYGIFKANLWIYVGRGDIRSRLLDHLGGDNPLILSYGPTHYVTLVTANDIAAEKQLILELRPVANQKVG